MTCAGADESSLSLLGVEGVTSWLRDHQLYDAFAVAFADAEVNGEILVDLRQNDLIELDVGTPVQRDLLMEEIALSITGTSGPHLDGTFEKKITGGQVAFAMLSVEGTTAWLKAQDFCMFVAAFADVEVNGEMLVDLRAEDLAEIGAGTSEEQARLLQLVHGAAAPASNAKSETKDATSDYIVAQGLTAPASDQVAVVAKTALSPPLVLQNAIAAMAVESVTAWLKAQGFGMFAAVFADIEINGEMLIDLNSEDLVEIGAGTAEEQARLLQLVADKAGTKQVALAATEAAPTFAPVQGAIGALNVEDVTAWLKTQGLGTFIAPFLEIEMNGEMLVDLRSEDLMEIGAGTAEEQAQLLQLVGGAVVQARVLQLVGGAISHTTSGEDGTKQVASVPAVAHDASAFAEVPAVAVVMTEAAPTSAPVQGAVVALDVEGVTAWLKAQGLGTFIAAFADSEVNGEMLVDLQAEDLRSFNAGTPEERASLLHAVVQSLRFDASRSIGGTESSNGVAKALPVAPILAGCCKQVSALTVAEVAAWLRSKQLPEFARAFEANEIHGSMLLDVRLEDADDFAALSTVAGWQSQWMRLLRLVKEARTSGITLQ